MAALPDVIADHLKEIHDLCAKHHVKTLTLFGSAARGEDFDPERSDFDFLVEFLPEEALGWSGDYFKLSESLAELLGRKVDLVEPPIRNPYLRQAVYEVLVPVYVAA